MIASSAHAGIRPLGTWEPQVCLCTGLTLTWAEAQYAIRGRPVTASRSVACPRWMAQRSARQSIIAGEVRRLVRLIVTCQTDNAGGANKVSREVRIAAAVSYLTYLSRAAQFTSSIRGSPEMHARGIAAI